MQYITIMSEKLSPTGISTLIHEVLQHDKDAIINVSTGDDSDDGTEPYRFPVKYDTGQDTERGVGPLDMDTVGFGWVDDIVDGGATISVEIYDPEVVAILKNQAPKLMSIHDMWDEIV